jgi:hypothetical protein
MGGDVSSTTIRAVVVRADGEAVLVTPSGLPQVVMSDQLWFPDVEAPLRAFHDQLGIDGYVLVCLEDDRAADRIDYLLVSTGTPAGEWVTDVDDPLVKAARIHLDLPADQPVTPAWTKPGWYAEALPWIDDRLTAAESPRTGVPVQVRSWGLSNVLRCPTTKGDVYFKAIAHSSTIRPVSDDALPLLFAHEPLLLRQVADERPGLIPSPLAIDEERAWMLLPDLGPMLASQSDVEVWIQAVRGHAQLQRSYADQPDRLLAFSCVDRRLAVLDGELDRLFGPNPATELLEPAERAALPTRAAQLREAINELAAIGVPETLLHGDLHPRNLAVRDGRVLAFDWTDAALAHPFLDLVTFFEEESPLSNDPRVRDAYLAEWEEYAAPAELRRALELAQELGAVHQVMTSLHLPGYLSGPSASSMLRGAHWWLRRLLEQ